MSREQYAEVLAAHVRATSCDSPFVCSCEPGTQDSRSHIAHLADVLATAQDVAA